MVYELKGEDKSLWVGTTKRTDYPKFNQDNTLYDVVVVGGGITGIAAAYYMQQAGQKVAVIEKGRIVEWTTGGTTAKLTSQHYLTYDYLIKRHGKKVAAAFAKANQDGIDEIENLSKKLGIDCDFSRQDAYVFTNNKNKIDDIKLEVEAAKSLGLPASFEEKINLPMPAKAAIKFTDQAQFHPRKFLLRLAEIFVASGGVIYENTEATDIIPGSPHQINIKSGGHIHAKFILQASGEPFWGNEIFKDKMWIKMSYGLAVTLKNKADYPEGMYMTTDEPLRTIRYAPHEDSQVLIYGGESHEYSDDSWDPDAHYKNLIRDIRKQFDVDKILYRWLAGDYMPYDRIPYIGPMPKYPSIYVVTGYRAWGLAWAMSAAQAILGYAEQKPPQWAAPFSLDRLKLPTLKSDKNHRL